MIKKLPNYTNLEELFKDFNVESVEVQNMKNRKNDHTFLIKNMELSIGNLFIKNALPVGADVSILKSNTYIDCVLICNTNQLKKLIEKEKSKPSSLKKVVDELEKYLHIQRRPLQIMGVLNINSDSFFKESRVGGKSALDRALKMIDDGADILDIGGVSSRPGSKPITAKEELDRVKSVIDTLYENSIHDKAVLSLDSYQPNVLEYALDRGFSIVNDITGLENDEVCNVAGKYGAQVCIMHMQNSPENMQNSPEYDDVVLDLKYFFKKRIEKARSFGIKEIILDVGIGFGKNLEHNIELINSQEDFLSLGYPLLIGASRKSMIDKIIPTPIEDRVAGTLAIHYQSVLNGASVVRCHDVKEHYNFFKVLQEIRKDF